MLIESYGLEEYSNRELGKSRRDNSQKGYNTATGTPGQTTPGEWNNLEINEKKIKWYTKQKIIIYQVFTRLFGNNSLRCKPNGSLEENGCGKMADFTTKALNEIKTLGATHIWYTGIIEHATQTNYTRYGIKPDHPAVVKGKAGSPYAIKDYYDVDPDLATSIPDRMKEFENLVTRSHKAGLKVIIDFVPTM